MWLPCGEKCSKKIVICLTNIYNALRVQKLVDFIEKNLKKMSTVDKEIYELDD